MVNKVIRRTADVLSLITTIKLSHTIHSLPRAQMLSITQWHGLIQREHRFWEKSIYIIVIDRGKFFVNFRLRDIPNIAEIRLRRYAKAAQIRLQPWFCPCKAGGLPLMRQLRKVDKNSSCNFSSVLFHLKLRRCHNLSLPTEQLTQFQAY